MNSNAETLSTTTCSVMFCNSCGWGGDRPPVPCPESSIPRDLVGVNDDSVDVCSAEGESQSIPESKTRDLLSRSVEYGSKTRNVDLGKCCWCSNREMYARLIGVSVNDFDAIFLNMLIAEGERNAAAHQICELGIVRAKYSFE